MKVAIVHDWLTGLRGGERCLLSFLDIYPQADIFTLLHVPGATSAQIDQNVKVTSWLQKIPQCRRFYRLLLPLYPGATSGFDFSGYDLIISLSHAAAKNIQVAEATPHICYCFTPMRYVWDQAEAYFGRATPLLWPGLRALRRWDLNGARRITEFVGISRFVAARIRCFYGRKASVIYPPVDTSWIKSVKDGEKGEAFLYAGALVPYKKPELVVRAFNRIGAPLWIVGGGPEEKKLKSIAKSNISFFGQVSDQELAVFYQNSRGLVFPGTEDFGMVPIECMAAGRPVIALYDGALRETIVGVKPWERREHNFEQACGVFIKKRDRAHQLDALVESVQFFIENERKFKASICAERAALYQPARFYDSWNNLVSEVVGKGSLDRPKVGRQKLNDQDKAVYA
jgi:glycosyltransferase involved in cell wall biosynthesis